jgi:D-alanyl-D-alanine dipeptidase
MINVDKAALCARRLRNGGLASLFVLASASVGARAFAQHDLQPGPQPPDVRAEWKPLIGDYGPKADTTPLVVFERDGELFVTSKGGQTLKLGRTGPDVYSAAGPPASAPQLHLDRAAGATIQIGGVSLPHRDYVAQGSGSFAIHPARPVAELRKDALGATVPTEAGPFRKPDLVDVTRLDPAIHLDVRYASSNNFLGTPVYTEARAFLQRPAADAMIRALGKLKPLGYGLLIHDAYRPWYVTKIFWDATPPEGKIFVADPAQGSRHNRGCAVDLTLYDLASGKPIEMPGTYDEMSQRSFPTYPGGTSVQRWHRELLRSAMESEGFTVYETEWWHFDYRDWKEYPILNIPFEKLGAEQGLSVNR